MKKIANIKPFFIEMIIVLLVMSVSSVVVIKLFVAADMDADFSREKNHAVIKAQEVIEMISSCNDKQTAYESMSGIKDKGKWISGFDYVWRKTSVNPRFKMTTEMLEEKAEGGTLVDVNIVIYKISGEKSKKLYNVSTKKYFSEAGMKNE